MERVKFPLIVMVLIPLFFGQNTASSFSKIDIEKLSSAKSLKDVFQVISETNLQTTVERPISNITDMAVDSAGSYIVVDGWQSKSLYISSSDGQRVQKLGKKGQGLGEYANPVRVEIVRDGEVSIADFGNNQTSNFPRILRYKRQIVLKPRILYSLEGG